MGKCEFVGDDGGGAFALETTFRFRSDEQTQQMLVKLAEGPVGPFHPDLILNTVEDPEFGTKADAFTIPIAVEGFLVDGQNRLEIEVMDQRDGFLDTALLLGATDGGIALAPAAPPRAEFSLAEDASISGDVALPAGFTPDSIRLAPGGGVDFGDLTLNDDGSFAYTPDANAFGDDGFVFEATSGGETVTGVVDLVVTPVQDAPIAQDDAFGVNEGGILTGDLFANNGAGADRDVDGHAFNVIAVNGMASKMSTPITLASGAILTVMANGAFSYDLNGAFADLNDGDPATEILLSSSPNFASALAMALIAAAIMAGAASLISLPSTVPESVRFKAVALDVVMTPSAPA